MPCFTKCNFVPFALLSNSLLVYLYNNKYNFFKGYNIKLYSIIVLSCLFSSTQESNMFAWYIFFFVLLALMFIGLTCWAANRWSEANYILPMGLKHRLVTQIDNTMEQVRTDMAVLGQARAAASAGVSAASPNSSSKLTARNANITNTEHKTTKANTANTSDSASTSTSTSTSTRIAERDAARSNTPPPRVKKIRDTSSPYSTEYLRRARTRLISNKGRLMAYEELINDPETVAEIFSVNPSWLYRQIDNIISSK
jgi:hypothetical protein